ncbi:MAG: nucleotidyltransferase family protein [Deltaproteobacteria bacterium]|nr:nucleotidyltransferase family protein [Deltaproteobacteria bacterium]
MNNPITQFVIQCIKPDTICAKAKNLTPPEFLLEPISWLKALALSEKLYCKLPFLVNIDRTTWKKEIPESIQIQLDEQLKRELMLFEILENELNSVLFLLINAGVPTLLIKGLGLANRFYPEKIYRPVTQIQLFVWKETFFDIIHALGHGGYEILPNSPGNQNFFTVTKRGGGPLIKFQKTLFHIFPKSLPNSLDEACWHMALENQIPSLPGKLKVLNEEDELFNLVYMATGDHLLESPVILNDLHFLIESPSFQKKADWDRVIWHFAHYRLLASAWFVLKFLSLHWNTRVPKEMFKDTEKEIGFFKKKWLSGLADPYSWFSTEEKSFVWTLRSKYLLRGNAFDAIKYSIKHKEQPSLWV